MIIRKISNKDLESISRLHIKVFDKSYFSVYYTISDLCKYFSKLVELNQYCYVCEENNLFLGYLIGGLRTQEAVNSFMKENRKRIIYYIIKNPKFIGISISKMLKKIFNPNLKSKVDLRLFLIGVDPSISNHGLGALLLNKFEEEILLDSYFKYGLFVRVNNQKAINFYLKRGFIKEFKNHDLFSLVKQIK